MAHRLNLWFYTCISMMLLFISSCTKTELENINDHSFDYFDSSFTVGDTLFVKFAEYQEEEVSSITFGAEKDAALLLIESGSSWTAETDGEWIDLAISSGNSGKTAVLAGVPKNLSVPRKGSITISSSGDSRTIEISQSGANIISFTVGTENFSMVLVDSGAFTLGSNDLLASQPAYEVTLNSYYICETEVTNSLWKNVMSTLPYDGLDDYFGHDENDKPQSPVSAVTWDQVVNEFLPEINSITGLSFRLPTEAEWEYAAMGGKYSNGYDYSGSDKLEDVGWYDWNSGNDKHPVKKLLPNELGLYDMSGNVSEWCSDWYSYYYDSSDTDNPAGPDSGSEKVLRGGNYASSVQFDVGNCGVKYRDYLVPDCTNGCWGDTGSPDEPICFRCKPVGFRFVLAVEN